MPTFEALKADYTHKWASLTVRSNRVAEVTTEAKRLIDPARKPRYQAMAKKTTVPWFVIAIIDMMEAGGRFTRHLHNGDDLSNYTQQVPAGRPPYRAYDHGPPFTWEESAEDALMYDGLHKITDWSVERAAYEWEKYQGFGDRNHGIAPHYLYGGTNIYTGGGYPSDGHFDPSFQSQQIGALALLKEMMALDPDVTFSPGTKPIPITPPIVTIPIAALIAALGSFFSSNPFVFGAAIAGGFILIRALWQTKGNSIMSGILSTIWKNPFTTTVGSAGVIIAVAHALGFNIPGVDAATLAPLLAGLVGIFAKDGNVTGK